MLVSYKKNRYMTKAARAFLEFLREYYATERVENCSSAADNGGRGHSPARTSIRSARAAYSLPAPPHTLRPRRIFSACAAYSPPPPSPHTFFVYFVYFFNYT